MFRRLIVNSIVAVAGLVIGGAVLYVSLLRSDRPLELWHTVKLQGEFTADQADEVRSFADYQQIEARLFAQVQEQVYAKTGSGAGWQLVRYSRGSLADPATREPDWNRSFELLPQPGRSVAGGILLLHGMSDGPYSLRALGQSLSQAGYRVLGLRLPGHGTIPSGLKYIRQEDLAAAVELGMRHLASQVDAGRIHIIGYSNGAALAVNYALQALSGEVAPRPASLVLLSPAIGISRTAMLAPWIQRLSALPWLESLAWSALQPEYDPYKYNSFAINAGAQVYRLTRYLAAETRRRDRRGMLDDFPPTLAFLSAVDATVTADAVVDNLLGHLQPDRHELVLFDVNRDHENVSILVADPGPLTARLMANDELPFRLTLLTNKTPDAGELASLTKAPRSAVVLAEETELAWPQNLLSLSHVALPIPPDDPLYGQHDDARSHEFQLGGISLQGETGLLLIPADTLMRARHNPFFSYIETRTREWVGRADD